MSNLPCFFRSTDQGAPTLTGQVGSAASLLQACLVDGFGSVAISSMTRSGSVVTVTTGSAHGFEMFGNVGGVGGIGPVVHVSGANESDYNGRWRVASVVSTTVFTFNIGVATPASPATGTMSVKRAGAGWTLAYSSGNKRAFRAAVGSTQMYLRVDDNATSPGDARSMIVRGYETMSDVDTGTGLFPTTAQQSAGNAWPKSSSADATARNWVLIADGSAVYWFPNANANVNGHRGAGFHGDLAYPLKPADAYHALNIGGAVDGTIYPSGGGQAQNGFADLKTASMLTTASNRHYLARPVSQVGSSALASKFSAPGQAAMGANSSAVTFANPEPASGGYVLLPVYVVDTSAAALRGQQPGLYNPLHAVPFADLDVLDSPMGLVGRHVVAIRIYDQSGATSQCCVDLTGPWR